MKIIPTTIVTTSTVFKKRFIKLLLSDNNCYYVKCERSCERSHSNSFSVKKKINFSTHSESCDLYKRARFGWTLQNPSFTILAS